MLRFPFDQEVEVIFRSECTVARHQVLLSQCVWEATCSTEKEAEGEKILMLRKPRGKCKYWPVVAANSLRESSLSSPSAFPFTPHSLIIETCVHEPRLLFVPIDMMVWAGEEFATDAHSSLSTTNDLLAEQRIPAEQWLRCKRYARSN